MVTFYEPRESVSVSMWPQREEGAYLLNVGEAPDWEGASCTTVDPNLWFPELGETGEHAKAICTACPIRQACLQYAIDNSIRDGIWGGVGYKTRCDVQSGRVKFEDLHQQAVRLPVERNAA